MNASSSLTRFAPAKLNLFLAVTGRRSDGFHDLVSLAAPLDFGDELELTPRPAATADELVCAAPDVPADGTNLVLRAAQAWRAAGGRAQWMRFTLRKLIPAGAGLGGGSSDAVAALLGLQEAAECPLAPAELGALAAALGSDCPLFLAGGPVILRGRGERIEPLDPAGRRRLAGRHLLVCKPGFGIATAWAYARLAAGAPGTYAAAPAAEARLARWREGRLALEDLVANSFQSVVAEKFVALPALAQRLQERGGWTLHLTGSGSACFILLPADEVGAATAEIRAAWGAEAFVRAARLAPEPAAPPAGNSD